jgi:hypothetical protein
MNDYTPKVTPKVGDLVQHWRSHQAVPIRVTAVGEKFFLGVSDRYCNGEEMTYRLDIPWEKAEPPPLPETWVHFHSSPDGTVSSYSTQRKGDGPRKHAVAVTHILPDGTATTTRLDGAS